MCWLPDASCTSPASPGGPQNDDLAVFRVHPGSLNLRFVHVFQRAASWKLLKAGERDPGFLFVLQRAWEVQSVRQSNKRFAGPKCYLKLLGRHYAWLHLIHVCWRSAC